MNRAWSADTMEVDPVAREKPARSAPGAVYALLTSSRARPRCLDDWLSELAKALGTRHVSLAVLSDDAPVVRDVFPKQTEPSTVSWPWEHDESFFQKSPRGFPAEPSRSADGRSSFLTVAVHQEGVLWILCLEDAGDRTWSVEEHAALTLAALGLLHFASAQESGQRKTDWSGKAQTQQRLEDAAAVVGRLSHDFNNVLTSVMGFTELSFTQLPPASPQRKLMAEVYSAAQQGSELINRLSWFSTRRKVPASAATALSVLLAEEERRLRKSWRDTITLEIRVPPNLPALAIDADPLRLILDKLIENAREAISTTGTVSVSAQQVELSRENCLALLGRAGPGPNIEITVADSGRGFSAEARRRIWTDPFFSTKPRHRGLGLASVYGVLMNYGGGIRLEHVQASGEASAPRETGTRVCVYVPIHPSSAEAPSPERAPACSLPRRPGADDHEGMAISFPARAP